MTIVVVGAGGNIGSHLVAHLARLRGVVRIVLVDPDVYDAGNVASQDITRRDVGQAKVLVQASRLRRIAPELHVTAIADRVENVPLGQLRGDVLLAALDSRGARRTANWCAWRLGMAWIDAGVRRDGLLARVNVYVPEAGAPCWECGQDDDAPLEQTYPCAGDETPLPTNAPSALGALAAALQAIECEKLLGGQREYLAAGQQVTISALTHRHYVTRTPANPACRFDHARWDIATCGTSPDAMTVADAYALGRDADRLQVTGQMFVRALVCPACGERRRFGVQLLGRLGAAARACPGCGGSMRPAGGDVVEWLSAADAQVGTASLAGIGARDGDVLTLAGPSGVSHVQIGGLG